MKHRIRTAVTAVAMALGVVAMLGTAAFAQYPPAATFSVSCAALSGTDPADSARACTVAGALAGERLDATAAYSGNVFHEETLVASDEGEARFTFSIPEQARGREITVSVRGEQSGEVAAENFVLPAPGASEDEGRPVEAPDRAGTLAFTGSEAMTYAAVGALLLGGGVALVRTRRREEVDA